MDQIRIEIATPFGRYPVIIAEGLVGRLHLLLRELGLGERRFVISNPLVWRFHGTFIGPRLPGSEVVLIPEGERFKVLSTVTRIYDALVNAHAERSATLIAIGGGVVGDIAGFAAATYLRGINFVQVPTTLLAQVDSAIGGKVGVNHAAGKNLIGAFYQPRLVAIDPLLLKTLERREFRAGLYEVIKYGMALSADLFARLGRDLTRILARDPAALIPIIADSCRIKASVVEQDERESGPRRVLNFGHTAGHALEAVTKYRRYRHGEAIAYGMMAAAQLAIDRGLLAPDLRQALASLIGQLGPLPPIGDLQIGPVIEAMTLDKKVADGKIHFVLPTGIGSTTIVNDLTERDLKRALKGIGMKA
ncbi:MAG: 3-dehydroquinate synthase [Acidobacteria bacterium]|nr:3-dehydroquinate synthase [Acidobacteriota bacterium]MBI3264130.1 3-dehydroquinate synthase [Acidobacteriota bacterium]